MTVVTLVAVALTLDVARILGEDSRIGSVTAGKRADLAIVRGDPVRIPSDIYDVVIVFRDGVGFDSTRLRGAVPAWSASTDSGARDKTSCPNAAVHHRVALARRRNACRANR